MTWKGIYPFRGTVIRGPYTSVALFGLHEIILLIHMAHMFEQTEMSAGTFCRPVCALSCGRRRAEALKIVTKPPVLNLSWKDSNSSVGHVIACLHRPRRLITVFTNLIQFIRSYNIYFKIILLLSSILRLDLQIVSSLQSLYLKLCKYFSSSHYCSLYSFPTYHLFHYFNSFPLQL